MYKKLRVGSSGLRRFLGFMKGYSNQGSIKVSGNDI